MNSVVNGSSDNLEPKFGFFRLSRLIACLDPRAPLDPEETFANPRPLVCLTYALLATLLVCWPVWPGLMSFDSLFSYKQSISGVETAIWPPMHVYELYLSRIITGGPQGLFAFQTFGLFFGAAILLAAVTADLRILCVRLVLFLASFWLFPTLLGTAIAIWKDVPVVTFTFLAVAAWIFALRRGSPWFFGLAMAFVFGAAATRWNALPLLAPWLLLAIVFPWRWTPKPKERIIAAACAATAILAAASTAVWRLPDGQRLPTAQNAFAPIMLFDLVGVSACVGQSVVPAGVFAADRSTPDVLRNAYDPMHLNKTFDPANGLLTVLPESEVLPLIDRGWRDAVTRHTGCYIAHRLAIQGHQYGIFKGPVFYPSHGGIDPNSFDIRFAHPEVAQKRIQWVSSAANSWPARAFVLHGLGLLCLVASVFTLRGPERALTLVFGIGVLGFAAMLAILSPAADARYVFPSNLFCAIIVIVTVSSSVARWNRVRARLSPTLLRNGN